MCFSSIVQAVSDCFRKFYCTLNSTVFLQMITPANTPATPPNFPDTLLAFSKLSASDKVTGTSSGPYAYSTSPPLNNNSNLTQQSAPVTTSGHPHSQR